MSFVQFECSDLTESRWYFSRQAVASLAASSLPQEGGGIIHTLTMTLMPSGVKELTALYNSPEERDTQLEALMYHLGIEDKLTPVIRARRPVPPVLAPDDDGF